MGLLDRHKVLEKKTHWLLIASTLVVLVGGAVEIIPNFFYSETIENVEGVRPYTPLELAGRDIYRREGCFNCHSQMVRTLRDEVERYGHFSLAAESQYDHPFLWGSKRTGPDLARVGGKYSNEWHVDHLVSPQSVVPESIMPRYPHLKKSEIKPEHIDELLATHRLVGVPYSDEMIAQAKDDFYAQSDPDADHEALLTRYPKAPIGNFDGQETVTEMDALVAYLQVLGTMVDFSEYDKTLMAEDSK